MRILMTTSVYPRYAGDATPPFVQHLAVAMARQGHDILVLAPHGPGAAFAEEVTLPAAGQSAPGGRLRIRRFPYFWPWSLEKLCYEGGMLVNFKSRPWTKLLLPFLIATQFLATLWMMLRYRPHLIHSHSILPQGFTASLVAWLLRRPHLTTSHGNDVFGLRPTGMMGRLKRQVLRQVRAVTVNSRATGQAVRDLGCPEGKIHLIPAMPGPSAPDPAEMTRIRREIIGSHHPVLIFTGRMIEDKGVGDLLNALPLLRKDFPDLLLLLVGDGQDRECFAAQAEELNLPPHLHWAGWVPSEDIPSWMGVADVQVVPSRENAGGWREAQGLVVVEAMQAGCPVVATRTGGIPDMVIENETGYLVPTADPAHLAAAINKLLSDSTHARTLGQAGQERAVKFFSPQAVTRQTEALFEQILHDRSIG